MTANEKKSMSQNEVIEPQNKQSDLIPVTALALIALLIGLAITV